MKNKTALLLLFSLSLFPARKIKIASFNIQIFGQKKCNNQTVINRLAAIITNFDLTAVQEIRDISGKTMPFFLKKINKISQAPYQYVISRRVGRTRVKEQYAFIYNRKTVKYNNNAVLYNDRENDNFEREPFLASFTAERFDFTLINIHLKPGDVKREIKALENVFRKLQQESIPDKDIIILGDLNTDCRYFDEDQNTFFPKNIFSRVINNALDTTVSDSKCTYDRIIFSKKYTDEDYAGPAGVFKYDSVYKLKTAPLKISDHYPVYAVFYTEFDSD